jgi:hypothetical protein
MAEPGGQRNTGSWEAVGQDDACDRWPDCVERDAVGVLDYPCLGSFEVIVGIHGLKQAGKSTVASIFEQFGFQRASFAGPLKAMLEVIGVPAESLHGSEAEKNAPLAAFGGHSGRRLAQLCGTEFGRNMIHKDIWVDMLLRKVSAPGNWVVDDLRMPNELSGLQATDSFVGAFTIHLSRPDIIGADSHASEAGLDPELFDCQVINDGTRGNLANCADWLAKTLSEGHYPLVRQYRTSRFVI